MKKKYMLLVIIMVIGAITGCGNGNRGSDTTSATSETQAATTAAPSTEAVTTTSSENESSVEELEPVTVTVMSAFAPENPHGPVELAYAKAYADANSHITMDVQAIASGDIYTKIVTLASSNDMPTLFYGNGTIIATYDDMDIMQDITPYLSPGFVDGFVSGVMEQGTVSGKLALFACSLQPLAMLYRIDRFEEKGLSIPTTWDEFLECAIALTDPDEEQWGFSMVGINPGGVGRFKSYLWSNGLELIYHDGNAWVTDVGTPEFMKAFSFWTDLNNVYHVVPDGITDVAYVTAANYFAMEYTSMILSGGNALGLVYDQNPALKGKVGTFVIPGGHPGTTLTAEGYILSKDISDAEAKAAVGYLEWFVTNDKTMEFWRLSGKLPSTTVGLEADYLKEPDFAGFFDALKSLRSIDRFVAMPAFDSRLGDAYSQVFSNEMTNEQAVAALIIQVNEILEENQ